MNNFNGASRPAPGGQRGGGASRPAGGGRQLAVDGVFNSDGS